MVLANPRDRCRSVDPDIVGSYAVPRDHNDLCSFRAAQLRRNLDFARVTFSCPCRPAFGDIVRLAHSHGVRACELQVADGRSDGAHAGGIHDARGDLNWLRLRRNPVSIPRDLVRRFGCGTDVIVHLAEQSPRMPLPVVAVAFPIEILVKTDEVHACDRFGPVDSGREPRAIAQDATSFWTSDLASGMRFRGVVVHTKRHAVQDPLRPPAAQRRSAAASELEGVDAFVDLFERNLDCRIPHGLVLQVWRPLARLARNEVRLRNIDPQVVIDPDLFSCSTSVTQEHLDLHFQPCGQLQVIQWNSVDIVGQVGLGSVGLGVGSRDALPLPLRSPMILTEHIAGLG